MKNEYQEVDKLITEALNEEEARYYKELEEQSLPDQLFSLYRGKIGWLTLIMSIVMVPVFGLTVYAGYHFFTGTDTTEMLKWGAIMFLGMMVVSFLKLFSWNQMDKNSIIRELKRLEYQVSILSKK
jgi:hypothetical protein